MRKCGDGVANTSPHFKYFHIFKTVLSANVLRKAGDIGVNAQMNTMRIWSSFTAILLVVGCAGAQTLVTECVHRDSSDHVIYLEREYRDADTMVYFMAYSDGGRVLKTSKSFSGDTLIETFRCHKLEIRPIPVVRGDSYFMVVGDDGYTWSNVKGSDSMVISITGYDNAVTWDTTQTNDAGVRLMELDRRSGTEYAAMVSAGELPGDVSKAELKETWEYRTLHGQLIDKRILSRNGTTTNRQYFNYGTDALVALSYFNDDTIAYAVDSISWDPDTTYMNVVNRWLDTEGWYQYSIQFMGDSSVFSSGGKTSTHHWVYDRTPWHVRMREAALREGPLCQSRIARAKESLIQKSFSSEGNSAISEHRWDADERLIETIVFCNGRFERKIIYAYAP